MNNNSRKIPQYLMHPSKSYSNFTMNAPPDGNFKPNTTQNTTQNNIFDHAFRENFPIIERHDFRNQQNVLHNNLGDSVLNEHITEYRINIDANDRDLNLYPNPFHFTTSFGISKNRPNINREFRNVKYIKIESIILPKFHVIQKYLIPPPPPTTTLTAAQLQQQLELEDLNHNPGSSSSATPLFPQTDYRLLPNQKTLDSDKFVILEIPELTNNRIFGTNTHNENGFLIFPERIYDTYYTGTTYYSSKTYDDSTLHNITKLTFIFKDSYGKPYTIKIIDENFNILNEQLDSDPENRINIHNLNNVLYDLHITLVIGVVENKLNTVTKYER